MTERVNDPVDPMLRLAFANHGARTEPEAADFDDGLLLQWRAGALDAERRAEVDAALAADPALRALALAFGDTDEQTLDDAVERAVAALPGSPRAARWGWIMGLAAAIALGLGGYLFSRPSVGLAPSYTAVGLEGGLAQTRGAQANTDRPQFHPGSTVVLNLRPAQQRSAPKVAVYASRPGGALRRVAATIEGDPGGGLRLQVQPKQAFGAFGRWVLHVVLAESEDVAGLTADAVRAQNPNAALLSFPLDYVPDPSEITP